MVSFAEGIAASITAMVTPVNRNVMGWIANRKISA